MNSVIYNTNEPFDFNKLSLKPPVVISGGNYFINYSMEGNSLYIQPPECKSRGSITKTSKKNHCDLMFSHDNTHFIKWMEDLETYSCKLIHDNCEDWFESEMDLSDIETYFASPLKSYKSGKFYLARANIPSRLGKIHLKIYNEKTEEVDLDSIRESTNLVTILEIQGIKCSSRSFQIEMEIKQMMTLEPVNLFENCLIASNRPVITHTKTELLPVAPDVMQDLEETNNSDSNDEDAIQIDTSQVDDKETEFIHPINTESKNDTSLEESKNDISLEENDTIENKTNEIVSTEPTINDLEFTVDLEKLASDETITIKPQNDIYYERYREAQKRAHIAKHLALQAYLEAKEIKNQYNLDDIESDEDDFFQTDEIHESA